jgi:hypothetical protein
VRVDLLVGCDGPHEYDLVEGSWVLTVLLPLMYGVSVGNVYRIRDEVKRKKKRKRLNCLGI